MTVAPPGHDPCAQARQGMNSVCGQARAAQQAHAAALEHTRGLRRRLAAARHAAEAAAGAASTDRRREEKTRLRARYRHERDAASSDAERAEVIARWARGLDRVNRANRRAQRALDAAQRDAAALESALREADQAERRTKVAAGGSEAACLEARVQLAACEEGATRSGPRVTPGPGSGPPRPPGAPTTAGPGFRAGSAPGGGVGRGGPPSPPALMAQPRIGQAASTVIETLLSRDRRSLEVVAMVIAEHIGRPPARVLLQVRELADAIVAVASQRGFMTIAGEHPFWAKLTDDEDRDVLAALLRMGFQIEPPLGWHGDRAPASSDLTMALAYAGIEARAMRNLPTAADLRELPRSVVVDARALLAGEAPDLALEQVVPMLGDRADALAALWDDWGQIRPLLLGDPRAIGLRPG